MIMIEAVFSNRWFVRLDQLPKRKHITYWIWQKLKIKNL